MKWPKNIKEAEEIQSVLRYKVKITPLCEEPRFVAGVDVAFSEDSTIGVACVYKYPELILLEETHATTMIMFPYVPGFLSFREGYAIIKALSKLVIKPDIILFDGQGIAHPSGIGIASHIGVLLNIPSIGCAKSKLIGDYAEPTVRKGEYTYLKYHDAVIGAVLRTRDYVKPVFVSPGHLIDLKGAIDIVLRCVTIYRIPEPIRMADRISKKIKKNSI